MTLQQLEYILALAQQRHFGKAAEQCNVTQPTLSAMIQKLEEEFRKKIFYHIPAMREYVCIKMQMVIAFTFLCDILQE